MNLCKIGLHDWEHDKDLRIEHGMKTVISSPITGSVPGPETPYVKRFQTKRCLSCGKQKERLVSRS